MVVKSAKIKYKKIKGTSPNSSKIPIKGSLNAAPAPPLIVYSDKYEDYKNEHKIPTLRNIPEHQDIRH